jgi:hypothetical protein
MKRPEYYILLIMLIIPVEVIPQASFGVFGGLGTYKMDNLKEINNLQAMSLPIKPVTVDNFNPGLYLGASFNNKLSKYLLFGLNYQFNSTGSRIGQKDYSGYYAYDQIVNGYFFGIEPEVIIKKTNSIMISVSIVTGTSFTSLEIKEVISISGQEEKNSESFTAVSFPLYPAVKLSKPFSNNISGTVSLGYLYDTGGVFHLEGQKNAIIRINDIPVKTGWTGFRITAGLRFYFNLTNPKLP